MEISYLGSLILFQFGRPYKLFAVLGVVFSVVIFIYLLSLDLSNLLLYLIFFLPVLKFLESIIVYRIAINTARGSITLRKTLGQITFNSEEVGHWLLRKVKNDSRKSTISKRRHLELYSDKTGLFIYPIPSFKSIIPYKMLSDNDLESLFVAVLGKPKNDKSISSVGLASLAYDFNFLLL